MTENPYDFIAYPHVFDDVTIKGIADSLVNIMPGWSVEIRHRIKHKHIQATFYDKSVGEALEILAKACVLSIKFNEVDKIVIMEEEEINKLDIREVQHDKITKSHSQFRLPGF